MRFVTYARNGEHRLAVLDNGAVVDLHDADPATPSDITAALRAGIDLKRAGRAALASATAPLPYEGLALAPVVPHPGKIICLGHNYHAHAAEGGNPPPTYPQIFLRTPTSLIAANADAVRPLVSDKMDYEAEVAVVIGTGGRHILASDALAHVFGYACFNDISIRDYQKRTAQWTIGKNFDGTGAFGPELVTADELPPGASGLRLQAVLNGAVMQDADTADMIFPVAETIALLSECMTLEPGDVIVSGTPAGVGFFRNPQVFMKAGDRIEIVIEGIGTLRNVIVDETAAAGRGAQAGVQAAPQLAPAGAAG